MQLNPTKLGTKAYWDEVYKEEKQNFTELGDEGEVWFGQDSVDKMVEWALENVPPKPEEAPLEPRILDIGTGNGILPICLVEAGYSPSTICGIDYSRISVDLAESVAEGRSIRGLTFREVDFINGKVTGLGSTSDDEVERWDVLMDKGTFDAMALSAGSKTQPEESQSNTHPTELYPHRVAKLLKAGGYFLITSCNFTEEEIKTHFTSTAPSLRYQYAGSAGASDQPH